MAILLRKVDLRRRGVRNARDGLERMHHTSVHSGFVEKSL
jgi:hypothetical protein